MAAFFKQILGDLRGIFTEKKKKNEQRKQTRKRNKKHKTKT